MRLEKLTRGCSEGDCAYTRYIGIEAGFHLTVDCFGAGRGELDEILGFDPSVVPIVDSVTKLSITLELRRDLSGEAVGDWHCPLPDAVEAATVRDCVGYADGGVWAEAGKERTNRQAAAAVRISGRSCDLGRVAFIIAEFLLSILNESLFNQVRAWRGFRSRSHRDLAFQVQLLSLPTPRTDVGRGRHVDKSLA